MLMQMVYNDPMKWGPRSSFPGHYGLGGYYGLGHYYGGYGYPYYGGYWGRKKREATAAAEADPHYGYYGYRYGYYPYYGYGYWGRKKR